MDEPSASSPALLAEARDKLVRAGLTADAVQRVLGDAQSLAPNDIAVAMYRLAAAGQPGLAHLATLFLLERPVSRSDIHDSATRGAIDAAVAAGLARESDGIVSPTVRLVPHGVDAGPDVWIASDLQAAAARPDFVPGVQNPTLTLTRFTPREPVDRAADIGTGCGLHALLLARHARTVVATDVNKRALAYARMNAELNDVHLDLRLGDLTAPLAGETFDLLVANPPYVISPESELIFRDSGEPGDSFNRRVATTIGASLAQNGLAVVLLSWAQRSPEESPAPLQWLAESDLDVLLLVTQIEDIDTAATGWNRTLAERPADVAERLRRWTMWYRDAGIENLGYGALVLRRTSSPAVHQTLPASGPFGPAGDQVLRTLTANETCADLDDEALAALPIALVAGVELERSVRAIASGAQEEHLLAQHSGLGIRAGLDASTWQLLESLARRPGATVSSLLPSAAGTAERRSAGALVRQLVRTGLVVITRE